MILQIHDLIVQAPVLGYIVYWNSYAVVIRALWLSVTRGCGDHSPLVLGWLASLVS